MVIFFRSAEPRHFLFGRRRSTEPQLPAVTVALPALDHVPSSPDLEKDLQGFTTKRGFEDGSNSEIDYPEGGRDAILTVFGAILVDFAQSGIISCVGVFQFEYATVLLTNRNASSLAWLSTFQTFFYYFTGAFIGRLFDSVGPTVLLVPGTFLLVLGVLLLSLCKEYYQFFLVQGFLVGTGAALVFYPTIGSITHFYSKRRATMMGVITAASCVGAVVFPIVLNKLIPVVGFPWTIRIMGFMCLVVLVPATFLVRSRLPRRKLGGFSGVVDFGGFRDLRYTLFALGAVLAGLGVFNPSYYIQTFSASKGYSNNINSYVVAIMNAGAFFGRLIPGYLADRFGAINILALSVTLASIMLFCWTSVNSPASLVVWTFVYGFVCGAAINLLPATVATLTTDMTKYGGRAGLMFSMLGFAALTGPPIAGALVDNDDGRYDHVAVFSGAICAAGAALFWGARFVSSRKLFAKY